MKKESPEVYGSEDTYFDIALSHDWPKGSLFTTKI